jgi:uncharacterized metal-binding protein
MLYSGCKCRHNQQDTQIITKKNKKKRMNKLIRFSGLVITCLIHFRSDYLIKFIHQKEQERF